MCTICSTTGVNFAGNAPPSPRYIGDTNTSGGLVPQITKPTQITVRGQDITGPRITVVDTEKPASWPAWIIAVNGAPVDNGAPGGTYQPQRLPDLVVTGFPWGWLIVLGFGLLLVVKRP